MLRRVGTILLLMTLLSFSFVAYSAPYVSADIADMYTLEVGGTMANQSYLTMPEVDTHIKITKDSSRITIVVTSNFFVVSNQTTNASLAFVYPEAWGLYYTAENPEFSIHVNSSAINYTTISYENLTANGFDINWEDNGGTWIELAEFVLFNVEMQGNLTYHIRVRTTAFPATNHYGLFSYIVGSAKTFSTNTHQIVEMLVIEEEPFLNFGFSPEEYLIESTNETGTVATWDLIIDDTCNISTVNFHFTENEYHGNPPPIPFPWAIYAGLGVVIVILGSGLIIRRRRMN